MSKKKKKIICVVDTESKQERKALVDYITCKSGLLVSVISEAEGYQEIYVREDDVWMAVTVKNSELSKKTSLHYSSFEEFKEEYENGSF